MDDKFNDGIEDNFGNDFGNNNDDEIEGFNDNNGNNGQNPDDGEFGFEKLRYDPEAKKPREYVIRPTNIRKRKKTVVDKKVESNYKNYLSKKKFIISPKPTSQKCCLNGLNRFP